jgi:hypothetical protein
MPGAVPLDRLQQHLQVGDLAQLNLPGRESHPWSVRRMPAGGALQPAAGVRHVSR